MESKRVSTLTKENLGTILSCNLNDKNNYSDKSFLTQSTNSFSLNESIRTFLNVSKSSNPGPEFNRFPSFDATLFAIILEDVLLQLKIMDRINTTLNKNRLLFVDLPILTSLKYNVEQPAVTDVLDGVDPENLECIEYKLKKLYTDRNLFKEVVSSTYADLSINQCCKSLLNYTYKIVDDHHKNAFLREEELRNRSLLHDIKKNLRQQRNYIKSATYDAEVKISSLLAQIEDSTLLSEVKYRYAEKWQNMRIEQNDQKIMDKESVTIWSLDYHTDRTDEEHRVHVEVELLINLMINDCLEKIEYWMAKYEKDMEALDLKIQIKKNDYNNSRDRRILLEETIEKHDKLMKKWTQFKDDRENARLYREKMTNAAITVQAWWRGLLVRQHLGPYKPKKKRGKK